MISDSQLQEKTFLLLGALAVGVWLLEVRDASLLFFEFGFASQSTAKTKTLITPMK
jgi:hypothetical protein